MDRDGNEGWNSHSWPSNIDGISLHSYTVPWRLASSRSPRWASVKAGLRRTMLKATLSMDESNQSDKRPSMDKYDPRQEDRTGVDKWGAWYARCPAPIPDSS